MTDLSFRQADPGIEVSVKPGMAQRDRRPTKFYELRDNLARAVARALPQTDVSPLAQSRDVIRLDVPVS